MRRESLDETLLYIPNVHTPSFGGWTRYVTTNLIPTQDTQYPHLSSAHISAQSLYYSRAHPRSTLRIGRDERGCLAALRLRAASVLRAWVRMKQISTTTINDQLVLDLFDSSVMLCVFDLLSFFLFFFLNLLCVK